MPGRGTGIAHSGVMPAPESGVRSVLTPDVDPSARATPVDATAPTPDLLLTGRAFSRARTRSVGVTVLSVLAVVYTLYFARDFLLPITLAVLLDFLFSPVVRALARVKVPVPIGAAVVVLSLLAGVSLAAYELSDPVQRWAARAPASMATVQEKVRTLLRPMQQVTRTAEQVERATNVGQPTRTTEVVVKGPSLVSRVFGTTQRLLVGIMEVTFLLYFLLAVGDLFVQKLVKVIPRAESKEAVVKVAREIESSISTYLLTAFAINLVEGAVVAFVLNLLGMPNVILWGTLVVVLEFVPYLGATVMTIVLGIAALVTFDTAGRALLIPGAFLAINLIQGNLLAPLLLGQKLMLNPVAIFVGLTFWFFMWGVPGAFIAVPVMAALKIVCDHVPSLAAIGEFLGRRDERERRWIVRTEEDGAAA
jgi:predicted PurR-regulated permease PerM